MLAHMPEGVLLEFLDVCHAVRSFHIPHLFGAYRVHRSRRSAACAATRPAPRTLKICLYNGRLSLRFRTPLHKQILRPKTFGIARYTKLRLVRALRGGVGALPRRLRTSPQQDVALHSPSPGGRGRNQVGCSSAARGCRFIPSSGKRLYFFLCRKKSPPASLPTLTSFSLFVKAEHIPLFTAYGCGLRYLHVKAKQPHYVYRTAGRSMPALLLWVMIPGRNTKNDVQQKNTPGKLRGARLKAGNSTP